MYVFYYNTWWCEKASDISDLSPSRTESRDCSLLKNRWMAPASLSTGTFLHHHTSDRPFKSPQNMKPVWSSVVASGAGTAYRSVMDPFSHTPASSRPSKWFRCVYKLSFAHAFVWFMFRVRLLFFPPDCFTSDAKVPLRNQVSVHGSYNMFDLARLSSGTHGGKMKVLSSLLIQWEGGVSVLGCYWAEWDFMAARLEILAAACCVCQRPVSCSLTLQTQWHLSDVL